MSHVGSVSSILRKHMSISSVKKTTFSQQGVKTLKIWPHRSGNDNVKNQENEMIDDNP